MDDLLHRCLSGDPGASDRFVDRHAPLVFGMVSRVVNAGAPGDPAVGVEDITQEVFLKLFRNGARLLRTYDPSRASFATWLAVIARSTAVDALRRKRPPTVPITSAEDAEAVGGRSPPSVRTLDVPTDLLSPRQRLVLHLVYDRGLSVAEAARILGIEAQSVRSARHKAVKRLRAFFGESQQREEGRKSGDAPRRAPVQQVGEEDQ